MSARVAVMAALVAGCSAGTAHSRVGVVESESDRMLSVIHDHCLTCHDDGLQLPRLGANVLTDRRLAIDVALMVSANRMPPVPATLTEGVRDQLVIWSCAIGRAAPNCAETTLAHARPAELVRSPRYYVSAALSLDPRLTPPPDATSNEADPLELLRQLDSNVRAFHLHPTYGALLILLAATKCRASAAAGANGAGLATGVPGVDEACVKALMSRDLLLLPPLPAAIGAD